MDINNIKQIAEVAKLKLSDEEISKLKEELESLLSYFAKVQEIEADIPSEKSNYMHNIKNTLREDEIKEENEDTKERIRSEFTKREEDYLIAPKSLK